MVCVTMGGRLGNQFFRYALARQIMINRGEKEELLLDFSDVLRLHKSQNDGYEDSLRYFNTVDYQTNNKRELVFARGNILQIVLYFLFSLSSKTGILRNINWAKLLDRVGIILRNSQYIHLDRLPDTKHVFVKGQCMVPLDFQDIRSLLRKEFTPIAPPMEHNTELYRVIQNTNSVCVSVRRGDYLSKKYKDDFFVCNEQYYTKALCVIRKYVDNPVFIFFSDDIEWVKKNINVKGEAYYEKGDDPVWETLRLMYSCKHYIMSNSSFSWLAQYLCTNTDKTVISPNRYYNNKDWSSVLLDDESFIKIEC